MQRRKWQLAMGAMIVAAALAVGPLIAGSHGAAEQEKPVRAQVGEKAPDFTLKDQTGRAVTLSQVISGAYTPPVYEDKEKDKEAGGASRAEAQAAAVNPASDVRELACEACATCGGEVAGDKEEAKDKRNIVILEWFNPECPFVVRHYREKTFQKLADKYAEHNVVWLGVNSTSHHTIKTNLDWTRQHNLTYAILDDHPGKVGRIYNARRTPEMYIIDRNGVLVYQGAIDDDPRGSKKPEERKRYVEQALEELINGSTISQPTTPAYGCTTKYAG